MDNDTNKDKTKLTEILNEITNLKNYSNELAVNIRGEKLENYVNNLIKNINALETKVEIVYEKENEKVED